MCCNENEWKEMIDFDSKAFDIKLSFSTSIEYKYFIFGEFQTQMTITNINLYRKKTQ